MDVKWIIDKNIYDKHVPREAFKKLGIEFHELEYVPFLDKYTPPYNSSECVITHGTINAVRHLKNYFGTFLREENLKYHIYCSNYAPIDYF